MSYGAGAGAGLMILKLERFCCMLTSLNYPLSWTTGIGGREGGCNISRIFFHFFKQSDNTLMGQLGGLAKGFGVNLSLSAREYV